MSHTIDRFSSPSFQEKSIKWQNHHHEMDGVTTNGILIMHIDGDRFDRNAKTTKWKEVSVGGYVFDLGEGRMKFNYQSAVKFFRIDSNLFVDHRSWF